MRRYAPVPSVESFTVDRRPACAFRNRLHHWRPSVRARFPLPAPQSGASGSTVAGRGALREYVAARAPSGLGHGGASPGAAGVRRPDVLGTTTFREILRRGIDMDREALMQWLRETSAALDAMDADITARIGEWPALRDSLHQTGEAMAALCADADAARERLIAAYRSEAEAVRQLVSGAAACAGAILGAGRAAAEEMVAAARADAERARTDAKASAVATLRDAQERAQHAVASAERLAEQRLAEVRHEADFILGEARRQAGEAAEAVATARQQAVETAARAQQDADAVLDDARRQAAELVAAARQEAAGQAAATFAEAQLALAEARRQADAVTSRAEEYVGGLVARLERLLPEQDELARAFERLLHDYSAAVEAVGRAQTDARDRAIPKLRRLLAALKTGGSVEDDEPDPQDGGAQSHAAPGDVATQPGSGDHATELTGTVAVEGASDETTARFVEALSQLPNVKRAVLATQWHVPRLAMIDVTVTDGSLADLDLGALQHFTTRVTNTTPKMVVVRVEENVDRQIGVPAPEPGSEGQDGGVHGHRASGWLVVPRVHKHPRPGLWVWELVTYPATGGPQAARRLRGGIENSEEEANEAARRAADEAAETAGGLHG